MAFKHALIFSRPFFLEELSQEEMCVLMIGYLVIGLFFEETFQTQVS